MLPYVHAQRALEIASENLSLPAVPLSNMTFLSEPERPQVCNRLFQRGLRLSQCQYDTFVPSLLLLVSFTARQIIRVALLALSLDTPVLLGRCGVDQGALHKTRPPLWVDA